ncbi:hypothetical protein BMW23_1063 [Bodo saltans virus]|uniref:Macro domain-containing protein n=1 Tax=Bodo saltans virus TaxID=2024608 RepID=A0A2H4UW38_9VIRU|nr:hypothetical protein QJ851_gp1044 [Bodo saltans virus]ATZ81107.1 hypothetical protein BMW23_1063 [Bodo saltans virus]
MNILIYENLINDCIKELSNENIFCEKPRKMLNSLIVKTPQVSNNVCDKMDYILKYESLNNKYISINDICKYVQITKTSKIMLHIGDITKLQIESIVNAGNENMLGCFVPDHKCVDNVIHCAAGPRLRNECIQIMKTRNNIINPGGAILTSAYSLPSTYIIHTVGPIILNKQPTNDQENELRNCYLNVLELCKINNIHQTAFTNISTGLFGMQSRYECCYILVTTKYALQYGCYFLCVYKNKL